MGSNSTVKLPPDSASRTKDTGKGLAENLGEFFFVLLAPGLVYLSHLVRGHLGIARLIRLGGLLVLNSLNHTLPKRLFHIPIVPSIAPSARVMVYSRAQRMRETVVFGGLRLKSHIFELWL